MGSRQADGGSRTDEGVVPVEDNGLLDELGNVGLLHVRVALLVPDHVRPAEVVDPAGDTERSPVSVQSQQRSRAGDTERSRVSVQLAAEPAAEPSVGARTW